jgi:hypothetical protein
MPLETSHVLNQSCFGGPAISPAMIKCVLQVVLQNSTTYGFSYTVIIKEVSRRGYKVTPRIIWKVLIAASYS